VFDTLVLTLNRSLVGYERDIARLVEVARHVASSRVVLKRPAFVPQDPQASGATRSRNTRFEIFRPLSNST